MFSTPADYAIELPVSARKVKPLVFNRLTGFEVSALRTLSYYAAREMNWNGGIKLPAYGYLFLNEQQEPGHGKPQTVVVGAAFFERDVDDSVDAEWFMTGVWLHPGVRGKGRFAMALGEMEAAFGHFAICGPYSEAFKALMKRHPQVAAHATESLILATG